MTEVYEVVAGTYQNEADAYRKASWLHSRNFKRATVRKVNPDAHPE